jgi:hypothetical protein
MTTNTRYKYVKYMIKGNITITSYLMAQLYAIYDIVNIVGILCLHAKFCVLIAWYFCVLLFFTKSEREFVSFYISTS